jgi:hypothetical protein
MSAKTVLFTLLAAASVIACAQRIIDYPRGCADRLASAYKQAECMACVTRPVPHQYLPDNLDGNRCFRR